MRIALAKQILRVPPSYFAIEHAQLLQARHEIRMFTLAAEVTDSGVALPIRDFVPWRSLPFRQRELFIPLFMHAMTTAIEKFEPDVIHQQFATWSWPAVRAATRASRPLVTTLHGVDVMTALRSPKTPMERWHHRNIRSAAERSARVLAVSRYLADRAVEAGFDPRRLDVHYQGVDTDFYRPLAGFDPEPDLAGERERPVVLFVGALNDQKGVRDLVEVSDRLRRDVEHRLVIVGTGPLASELRDIAAERPNLELTGRLAKEEIRVRLQRASVLVLPAQESGGRREAAGLVLLEAQACGIPVVAYDSGGTSEMLDPGSTGLLAAERDRAALERAVRQIVTMDVSAAREMGRAARRFVVARRSLAASAVELEQHYREVSAS